MLNKKTPLECLDNVISDTVSHISDFTKNESDFTRNRKLNAATTIKVTLNMQGQSLNTEMINAFPDMNERSTASAYEQQKAKLSPDVFMHIFREYNKTNKHHKDLFNGKYELYAIDGSDFNIPYQSKSKYALKPQKNKYREECKPYSILHSNLLFNLTDRTYEDIIIQPQKEADERKASIEILKRIETNNPYIVIMDRGYDGFNMIEHCNRLGKNAFYVIRTKTGIGGIKEISELPDRECDVDMSFKITTSGQYFKFNKDKEPIHLIRCPKKPRKEVYSKTTKHTTWDFKQFENVKCRVCKFRINNSDTDKEEWEVLVTNLDRSEFPISKMKEIYHLRWDIETSFRELKYALGAVQFHSRKDAFVEMELLAHLIMFNVVSRTISCVSVPQSKKKKYTYAVSFKDAVTLIRKYYRFHNNEPPGNIFSELLGYTRPVISGRKDKRNIKAKSAVWFVYRVA